MPHSSKADIGDQKLSNFLCFAVYSANIALGRAYKPIPDALGLTYTQYIAMVALNEEDDQTVGALTALRSDRSCDPDHKAAG